LRPFVDSLETRTVADLANEYVPTQEATYEESYPAFEGQALQAFPEEINESGDLSNNFAEFVETLNTTYKEKVLEAFESIQEKIADRKEKIAEKL